MRNAGTLPPKRKKEKKRAGFQKFQFKKRRKKTDETLN